MIIALMILHEALNIIFQRDSRLARVLLDLAIFPLPLLEVITANIENKLIFRQPILNDGGVIRILR